MSSSTEAQQVMKTLLKEVVIPKCEESKSKQDFQKLSDKLTRQACRRATGANITGQDKVAIIQAFNARSLGVIHDVHTQVKKLNGAYDSCNQRALIRQQLVMNGRKSETANKILLADSYVDLFLPIRVQEATNCNATDPFDKLTRKVSEEEEEKNEAVSPESMRTKFAGITPPRQRTMTIPTENESTDNADIIKQLKKQREKLESDLAATRHQVAVMQRQLKRANRELKLAKQHAQDDLKEQNEVLARTLALLGDATAKIAEQRGKPPSSWSRKNHGDNLRSWM